ncbi:MAG: S8 family serine peptidase [Phycisphaerales bacterium]|nr:S8 family serine peptidase [Phycisphaerales bacterium]
MKLVPLSTLAIVACCGLASPLSAQFAPGIKPFPKQSAPGPADRLDPRVPPTAAEKGAVWAESPKLDGRLVFSTLKLTTPHSSDPLAPNWMVYRGNAVAMPLRKSELMVRLNAKSTAGRVTAALAAVGVRAKSATDTGLTDDWIIDLSTPVTGETQMHALVRMALGSPLVTFAAPCFDDAFGGGRRVYATPNILASLPGDPLNLAAALAPDADVVDPSFGMIDGGLVLRPHTRDGFAVMAMANRIAADPRTRFAECDFRSIGTLHTLPNDPFFSQQVHLRDTSAAVIDYRAWRAWNYATGAGVRVLVMDSGAQQNHPDINQLTGRNFVDAPAGGNGDGGPLGACDDHGTAVGGTVSAAFNNGVGVAGVAPDSRTMAARMNQQVSGPCGSGFASFQTAWVVNALAWGRAQGCRVSNASFGLGAVSAAIDTAYEDAYDVGMIHFASAGNDGVGTIAYPSSAAYVNSVGGINSAGSRVYNWGDGLDFTGLAIGVITTDRAGAMGYTGTDYASVSGTSFSSPACAGAAALIMSGQPLFSNATVESSMRLFATNLGSPSYDTSFGWGIPNPYASITGPAPANDLCSGARTIDSWNYSHSMAATYATASSEEPQENCEAGGVGVSNSVFYRFTAPPEGGRLNLSTGGSNYDTVLSVFSGCGTYSTAFDSFSAPSQIACSDDANGTYQSSITNLALSSSQSVVVKVSGYGVAPATSDRNLVLTASFTPSPPANNTCTTAQSLSGTSMVLAGSTALSTSPTACRSDTPAPCAPSGKPVWYVYSPTADGYINLDTFGSSFDTVLSVHTGCPSQFLIGPGDLRCFAPTDLGCSDDASGTFQSRINALEVRVGSSYYIRVAGYRNGSGVVASGPFVLNIAHTAANFDIPANDDCSQATVIPGDQPTFTLSGFDTANATVPGGCGDPPWDAVGVPAPGHSVWWSFTPVADGSITVDTIGSGFDTVLSVYDGIAGCVDAECNFPPVAAANDDFDIANFGYASMVADVPVVAGNPYLIRVSAYNQTAGGSLNLNLAYTASPPTPPANDDCASAVVIPGDAATYTADPVDTRSATGNDICGDTGYDCDTGVPDGTSAARTVWYSYTPDAQGAVTIDTYGSTFDTALALFDGTFGCGTYDPESGLCDGPMLMACNNDAGPEVTQSLLENVPVLAGVPLLVRVAAVEGSGGGSAILNLVFTPDIPPPPECPADFGSQGGLPGHDGLLDNNDFVVFIDFFFSENPRADIGMQGGIPGSDGSFDNNDFVVFIDFFFAGCP